MAVLGQLQSPSPGGRCPQEVGWGFAPEPARLFLVADSCAKAKPGLAQGRAAGFSLAESA